MSLIGKRAMPFERSSWAFQSASHGALQSSHHLSAVQVALGPIGIPVGVVLLDTTDRAHADGHVRSRQS